MPEPPAPLAPSERTAIDSAELATLALPPLRWVVESLLPEGLTLLVGKPKLGKSWLALHIAVEVALGGRVLGSFTTSPSSVLYFALEDGLRRLQARQAIVYGARAQTPALRFALRLPQLDRGGMEALERALDARTPPALCIIDTLGRIQPTGAVARNTYTAEYGFVSRLQTLAQERRIALLLVHHERKSIEGGEDAYLLDKVLGTTGITGGVDNIILLQAEPDGSRRLHLLGRDVEALDFTFAVDLRAGSWLATEPADASAECEAVRQALTSTPQSTAAIARVLGKSERTARKHLKTLVERGKAKGMGAGRYMLG